MIDIDYFLENILTDNRKVLKSIAKAEPIILYCRRRYFSDAYECSDAQL
jgi:hypothetical protein